MKALVIVYSLLYLTTVSSSNVFVNYNEHECPEESPEGELITRPHETDCDKFYVCIDGERLEEECPDGLHFDPKQGTCDWPEVANCKITTPRPRTTEKVPTWLPQTTTKKLPTKPPIYPPPTTTTKKPTKPPATQPPTTLPPQTKPPTTLPPQTKPPTTTKKPKPPSTQPPQKPTTRPPATKPPQTSTKKPTTRPPTTRPPQTTTPRWDDPRTCIGECPLVDPMEYTVQLPNVRCNKFCKCSNGIAYVQSCPANLHYHRKLGVCDWPQYANCSGIGGNPLTTTRRPTTRYNVRVVREVQQTTTPRWQNPDSCIGDCPLIDPANYTVQLPHQRCDKFCKCSNGVAFVESCPAKLHYNKKLQVCDWPLHANCTGIGGIPPPTTQKPPQTTAKRPTTKPPQTTTRRWGDDAHGNPSVFQRMWQLW